MVLLYFDRRQSMHNKSDDRDQRPWLQAQEKPRRPYVGNDKKNTILAQARDKMKQGESIEKMQYAIITS